MKLQVASTVGQNSTLTVRDDVFGAPVNDVLIAQAIRVFLSNQRQGTSKVKTRSEINRTKKKWFKQKGTGNARHGARTASLFVGGGITHGPTGLQNWTLKMSATMKKSALISALSAQVANTVVADDIVQLDGKTSSANKMLKKMLPEAQHILIVLPKSMPLVMRSLRNLPHVLVTSVGRLNTHEVAYADAIVFTKESVHMIEEKLKQTEKVKKEVVAAAVEKTEKVEKVAKVTKPAAKPAKPKKEATPKKIKEVAKVKKASKGVKN